MANINTKIFKSLNESEYKELYTPKRALTEATTDANEIAEEYKKAYHIDLDWNRVPCVIARDKFLSGWGGAEGKTHYQVVLCGDSTEAANIESNMKSLGREEGLANIRRDFGVHLSPRVSKAYIVGRYASAWNNLSDSWYENRFDSGKTEDEINQEKDAQEERRQEKLRQKEQQANESEEVSDIEFKVGDVVKVPYKYGSYTPGEFTDAPIIDIEDGRYITVEVPSKQVVYIDQLRKWNNGINESENLKEEYSDKLGGDPMDFAHDVMIIKRALSSIDTNQFGSHLAQQMVYDWIDTCDYQIAKGARLASGNEFYTESEKLKEDSYDKGIFYEIEQAFEEAGLNPVRFIDDGILTRNIGWTVSSNGQSQQISCDGSWYDEDEDSLDESCNNKKELKEDIDTVHKMKDCTDDVEVIMALEGDTLELDDLDDWNRLKEIARGLASSQGFYGRLLANMEEVYDEDITFPVYL